MWKKIVSIFLMANVFFGLTLFVGIVFGSDTGLIFLALNLVAILLSFFYWSYNTL